MANPRFRSRAALAALSLALVAVCAGGSPAAAQVTDGIAACAWLKLKAKASGLELEDGAAGLGPKRSVSATCYMQLGFAAPDKDNPHGRYGAPLLCQVDFQSWEMTGMNDSYAAMALGDGNVIGLENYLTFQNDAGDIIQGYASTRLVIGVDKMGAFKKATLTSFSGELLDNSSFFETPAYLFGGFSVKGSTVPEAKVPAEARALVAGGPCSMAP